MSFRKVLDVFEYGRIGEPEHSFHDDWLQKERVLNSLPYSY